MHKKEGLMVLNQWQYMALPDPRVNHSVPYLNRPIEFAFKLDSNQAFINRVQNYAGQITEPEIDLHIVSQTITAKPKKYRLINKNWKKEGF
jgi:hypothetical protein